jgi:predicted PolB exonuclease-like 3'-5' exonuclease
MTESVLVWDIETVPDLSALARVHGKVKMTPNEAREALGGQFPKLPVHQIICIGAMIASRPNADSEWSIDSLGAPHISERSEADLISSFVERIASLRPQLVTYNGGTFDLPVLRFRAMLHRVSAPGLHARSYFSRFGEDSLDLCDVLASYVPQAKIGLDFLCKSLSLTGKPSNISGAEVERFFLSGRVQEIADYCEIDVVNTFRIWLLYELFRGHLSKRSWEASEGNLQAFLHQRAASKPHLSNLI